ncbi:serine aminopeptidase domain-containing protein [Sphingomonas sp.]|jgi:pimeloyl-ACP methyl ester carboxylesterase|uniref:serine aminopeptidase domain-containing protein n=1 Tax=Sphingomonas sp. TaxID=28214 RepID=UPI002D80EF0F|nr:alpha/beta hydrolase [Sphingomonas sp.]HEU0043448.1 alpha/beta hydrolase [Sphingomonas sp.]
MMRLLALLALLLAGPLSAAEVPPPSPPTGVRMTIYAIPSDPPGERRVAPGGGRVLTPVVEFTPEVGENIHGPAIVMLSKGPGSNPGYADQATRWAGERLAKMGYTVLSLQSHADRGFPFFPFEETSFEIDAALDALEFRGYEDFILIGEGYGAAQAAYYLANDPDPSLDKAGARRVRAAVMLDPLTELRHYPGVGLSNDYDVVIARARAAFARGRNGYTASRSVEVAGGPDAGNESWLGTGFFVAPAEGILNWWSPEASARNQKAYRANPVPTLALVQRGLATVSRTSLAAIKRDKKGGLDLAERARGGDYDAAVAQVGDWLTARGLGPRQRVIERLVDVTTSDGTVLTAALYMPERADPTRPAMLLAHGRSGEPIQSSTHWMGWRFAQQGYVVLAPAFRISGVVGIYTQTRNTVVDDMRAWMAWLARAGHTRVVAAGHSNGGIWVSDYKALTRDPRIVAMVYFAPTVNVETWAERQADAKQMAQMREACAAVKAGKGTEKIYGIMSATLVCDSLNQGAVSHPERLAEITVPGLFITGSTDALFKRPGVLDRLKKAYAGPLQSITIEGGTHGLRESKDRLATDVDGWLTKTLAIRR